jgi:hypothetical protein
MTTIQEIKQRNRDAGQHFFDEASMRFFNSRISGQTFGNYFVTSEKGPSGIRAYTVRFQDDDGHIWTLGEFQEYDTLESALQAARIAYLHS